MSTEAKSKVVMMLSQAEPSGKPSIGPFIMAESKDSSQISVQHRLSKKRSQQGEESKLSQEVQPKRKMKPASLNSNGNKTTGKMTSKIDLMVLEEHFFDEIDQDVLDRTLHQIKEERFFQKEFAKDLKKFEASQDEIVGDKGKKKKKYDLIDSFIEGELELDEILLKIKEKKKSNRQVPNNKRISEMFRHDPTKLEEVKQVYENKEKIGRIFTTNDYLDFEDNDAESLEDKPEQAAPRSIQTSLHFNRLPSVLN